MARGSNQAQTAANTANGLAGTLSSTVAPLYGQLQPELSGEAAAPAGINPSDMAKMNTSAKQAAGGSTAGAVGRGALLASRTRNAGAGAAAIADAARSGGQQESQEDLATQLANQRLKNSQQQAGLSGLENLYGTEVSGTNTALGQAAANVNANTGAANESWNWARYILDPELQASGAAAAGAGG
jgi:hypothetical protein